MSSDTTVPTNQHNINKRKRKKSFLKNARKYAKKGYYGRGSHLDPEIYQYFVSSMESYKKGFDSDEEKLIFVKNFFEQTVQQEINCSCNQVGCRIIETLLPFANESILERYMEAFSNDLRPLCSDRFASHVLEALVTQACKISLSACEENVDFKKNCQNFTLKISKFLLNNLEDYVWDNYSNHVIRTCLINLAQIVEETNEKSTKKSPVKSETQLNEPVPEVYTETVMEYGERIVSWPQFNELCNSDLTSGFLQVLLKCLQKTNLKLLKKYLKRLITEIFSPEDDKKEDYNLLPKVFLSGPAMMLMETVLQIAPPKYFTQIYLFCFVNRLPKLATTRTTNFAVQKLIANCKEKVEFEAIFEETKDHFKQIINAGHTGIILNLAKGCRQFATKQGIFVKSILESLDCLEPEERQNSIVLCLAKLQPFGTISTQTENLQKEKLNLHGTLIIQEILEFNKPIKVVNSILSLENDVLKGLFTNTMGSHLVDSYVKSSFVGEKSREKLIRKLKGNYQELVSSKFGSRSFEALWSVANMKTKCSIMEELSYKDGLWANSEHGKIIASKINLILFKRNKENWINNCNSKKQKLM